MHTARLPLLLIPVSLASAALATPQGQGHQHQELDAWSAPIEWRTTDGRYASAAHATLLPDGSIAFVGISRDNPDPNSAAPTDSAVFEMTPTPLGVALPVEVFVELQSPPLDAQNLYIAPWLINDDLFCAGNAHTSDGQLFTAGGTRAWYEVNTGGFLATGFDYAMSYDGDFWARRPGNMQGPATLDFPARWYPAVTRLPDGRMLVTGGYDLVYPAGYPNLSAEVYDPGLGTWQVVSPHPTAPAEIWNPDYTHPFVLPSGAPGELLMFGQSGVPVLLSLSGATVWNVRPSARPGTLPGQTPNVGATSLLLPLRVNDGQWGYANGSVLMAGGSHGTSAMRHADIFDPVADAWSPRIDIGTMRHHPTSVLLPDGRVLLVAGHNLVGDNSTRRAITIDPAKGFAVTPGSSKSPVVRGYHTVALLLPDGRVLVGGGRDNSTATTGEKSNFQYYYPGYMFGERPTILAAPAELDYGETFGVLSLGAAPASVVLVGLGSMTHSMDFDQRHIELEIGSVSGGPAGQFTLAQAPADAASAPPGHYMLFVLDGRRAPSLARMVHLD